MLPVYPPMPSLTSAQRAAKTPRSGESVLDSDTGIIYFGDGSTAGGVPQYVHPSWATTSRPLHEWLGDQYNAISLGMVADGVTDNYAAFQAAVYRASADKKTLFVPPGTYEVSIGSGQGIQIPSNAMIVGVRGQSKLHFTSTSTGQKCFTVRTGSSNVLLKDIVFYGNDADYASGTVPQYGLYFDNSSTGTQSSDVNVEGCELYYIYNSSINSNNAGDMSNIHITRNIIHDIGTVNHNMPSSDHADGIDTPQCTGLVIDKNLIWNIDLKNRSNTSHAIYFSRDASGVVVSDNVFNGNGVQAFGKHLYEAVISGNVIRFSTDGGIILGGACDKVVVTNNSLYKSVPSGVVSSYYAADIKSNNCIFANNVIDLAGTGGQGIRVSGGTNMVVANNTVTGLGSGLPVQGILLKDNSALFGCRISGNRVVGADQTNHMGIQLQSDPSAAGYTDITIQDNDISGGMLYGIRFVTGGPSVVSGIRVLGNRIKDTSSGGGSMWFGSTPTITGLEIRNNDCDRAFTISVPSGIIENNLMTYSVGWLPSAGTARDTSVIRGNRLKGISTQSITTGATPSAGSDVPHFLTYGSATQITNFTNCGTGEVRTFHATNGNATLVHGSGVLLSRGSSWTMASGDTVMLQYGADSVWREVGVSSLGKAPVHYFGSNAVTFGSSSPSTGTWVTGDVRFNTGVASGQPQGWRCTSGGTPGTWSQMPNF